MPCRTARFLCVPILLGLLAANTAGQPLTWDGEIDSNWYDPVNWDPDAFPADDANRIVLSGSPIASTDVRADNGGTIAVISDGWATFGANLYVADANTGTLDISGGGAVSIDWCGYIGYSAGSHGTVTVRDPCSTWTNSWELHVGYNGSGTLEIAGGGTVTNKWGYIAYLSNSNGTVTVDGAGSTWTNGESLCVGFNGTGTLEIAGGGTVTNKRGYIGRLQDSTGTVTVDGAGSRWTNSGSLYVGGSDTEAGGTGRLTVADGGRVEVGGILKIWPGGTVDVSGGTIRLAHPGSLERAGGTFAFYFGTVEFNTDLEVTADTGLLTELFGANPSVLQPNGLGITGQATLTVPVTLDGGTFSVGSLVNPALLRFHSGTFRLTDANLAIGPGGLFGATLALGEDQRIEVVHDAEVSPGGELGLQGGALAAGRLTNHGMIAGRGRIEGPLTNGPGSRLLVGPGQQLTVAGDAVNDGGEITLGGGTLWFEDTLTNTAGGLVMGNGLLLADAGMTNAATMAFSGVANVVGDVTNQPAGLIIASGGGPTTFFDDVVSDGEIRIGEGTMAVFFGSYSGAGSFPGPGTACFEGDLKPGSSPAVVTLGGSVAFGPGAAVEIELAGGGEGDLPSPGCDGLIVGGDVALDGGLELAWLPVAGDPDSRFGGAYTVLTWGGGRSGQFASVGGQLAAYLDTSLFPDGIEYDDANGLLRVHLYGLLAGDVDLDGAVGPDDLSVLEASFGSADAGWLDGDLNFDRSVDHLDYLLWKASAGQAVPGAGIPEPATLALLALGGLVVLRQRNRRGGARA